MDYVRIKSQSSISVELTFIEVIHIGLFMLCFYVVLWCMKLMYMLLICYFISTSVVVSLLYTLLMHILNYFLLTYYIYKQVRCRGSPCTLSTVSVYLWQVFSLCVSCGLKICDLVAGLCSLCDGRCTRRKRATTKRHSTSKNNTKNNNFYNSMNILQDNGYHIYPMTCFTKLFLNFILIILHGIYSNL
jgi:hypothetical protein